MSFGDAEEQIVKAATNYLTVLQKASDLAGQAPDGLLSGSATTIYLKKLGHRALTTNDSENVTDALGSEADKQIIVEFHQAQEAISERLRDNTRSIGLVLKQAKIPYDQVYKRFSRKDLWKPEQMIQIMEVLRRLQL